MAVPSGARKETTLNALIEARKLVRYSLTILASNKNFKARLSGDEQDDRINPPQPELVRMMKQCVIDIYISAYAANETPFTKNNYLHRRRLQDKSVSKCNELLALIEMCVPIFHIPAKRFGYWGEMIVCTRGLIQA